MILSWQLLLTFRSNSAHDLGETIDPELLPDLETLQESFEIPAQLRLDVSHAGITADHEHRSQAPYTHQDHGQEQRPQHQHHLSDVEHFNRNQGGASTDQQTAAAQPGSGAATPSRPCSTASDDSLQPGPQYVHSNMHQQPHGASTHTGGQSSPAGPVRLAHSRSLPLLEDVSSACCEIKCNPSMRNITMCGISYLPSVVLSHLSLQRTAHRLQAGHL